MLGTSAASCIYTDTHGPHGSAKYFAFITAQLAVASEVLQFGTIPRFPFQIAQSKKPHCIFPLSFGAQHGQDTLSSLAH